MEEIGLRRDKRARACAPKRISASVHGDDVTVKASRENVEWLIQKFEERYEIKSTGWISVGIGGVTNWREVSGGEGGMGKVCASVSVCVLSAFASAIASSAAPPGVLPADQVTSTESVALLILSVAVLGRCKLKDRFAWLIP